MKRRETAREYVDRMTDEHGREWSAELDAIRDHMAAIYGLSAEMKDGTPVNPARITPAEDRSRSSS